MNYEEILPELQALTKIGALESIVTAMLNTMGEKDKEAIKHTLTKSISSTKQEAIRRGIPDNQLLSLNLIHDQIGKMLKSGGILIPHSEE
ncbi:hypothetical protein [Xenorhabdus bovienii]|uniref:hypothetical protein n=1 Tax=Xenorhabdus bovienii TaxID=40576 RepID=UPI0004D627B9|nr:hypothetical protein [Xenorhabdus bovienii]CDG90114.1 putative Anti-adapter protein IraP [Xenorhabdus bovienii str. feltiae France]CDG90906.1 putative Anti-adapter protein IraP [Xenorhabdus bovienii str. feltiae Florida]